MNDIIKDKYIETTKRKNLSSYSLKKVKIKYWKDLNFTHQVNIRDWERKGKLASLCLRRSRDSDAKSLRVAWVWEMQQLIVKGKEERKNKGKCWAWDYIWMCLVNWYLMCTCLCDKSWHLRERENVLCREKGEAAPNQMAQT